MTGQGGPPEDPVCIAFDKGRDAAEKEIKYLCQRILPGWAAVAPEDMQVRWAGAPRPNEPAVGQFPTIVLNQQPCGTYA